MNLAALLPLLALAAAPTDRITIEDRAAAPRLLRALERARVTVRFEETKLPDVARFLAVSAGVPVIIAPALQKRLDEIGPVTLKVRDLSARQVLALVLDLKDLGAVIRHGVLIVTTREDARGKPVLRIYPIADLTAPLHDFPGPGLGLSLGEPKEAPAETAARPLFGEAGVIEELVRDNCGSGTWDDPAVSLTATQRHLVVRQVPAVHREIERLLALLR